MSAFCVSCGLEVRPRQHAVECDSCKMWTHRNCDTGITLDQYREALKLRIELTFICKSCAEQIPALEASMSENDDDVAVDDDEQVDDEIIDDDVSVSTSENDDMEVDAEESVPYGEFTMNFSGLNSTTSTVNDTVAARSFLAERSYAEPHVIHERSLVDQPPPDDRVDDQAVKYQMIPRGSQTGKDLLVDSMGYSYNVKEVRGNTRKWRCAVRNKNQTCPAAVSERSGDFNANSHEHVHAPDPNRCLTAAVAVKAKDVASKDFFKSAKTIVDDAAVGVEGITNIGLINADLVARTVNRCRENLRPEEPKDMDFEVNEATFPPGFYRGEVKANDRRHLIFATDDQLSILKTSARWYIDGTFKVMRKPFEMLLSIHAFVRRGDCCKQVPLAYILMTGRKTIDYAKVLKAVGRLLKGECCVEGIVIDFEKALWKAVREVFQGVSIHGCAFHWGQAVWRHVQALGLATEYMQDAGTSAFIRKLLSLPFLPAEHIKPTFEALCDLNGAAHLDPLLGYLRRNWLESSVWPVECWSVFGQSVRTNNDVEGWHRRLNGKAGVSPPFYILVNVLHLESEAVRVQVQLVTELSLRRLQRKSVKAVQGKVFAAWKRYREGTLTSTGLLKLISVVYRPRITKQ